MTDSDRIHHAFAPGRVNLIGDHTDYLGGVALPMTLQLGVTIHATWAPEWDLSTDLVDADGPRASLRCPAHPNLDRLGPAVPEWGRYVLGVAQELTEAGMIPRGRCLHGRISSDLPAGSGLSSSAAIELATAAALGAVVDATGTNMWTGSAARPSALQVARVCQRAEMIAARVPCGLTDQWAIAAGRQGHAMLMDFSSDSIRHIAVPENVAFSVVHSDVVRQLTSGAYAQRRAECEAAETIVGPLNRASLDDVSGIASPTTRNRARHVVSENQRVRRFAQVLSGGGPVDELGQIMNDSHRSLSELFEVSLPRIDALQTALCEVPGVYGARITGAGFGGCLVVVRDPQVRLAERVDQFAVQHGTVWDVESVAGAGIVG
jgi:galactokinase